jgi:hypothetical protein
VVTHGQILLQKLDRMPCTVPETWRRGPAMRSACAYTQASDGVQVCPDQATNTRPAPAAAAGGGLLPGFQDNVKASVFVTSFSFAMYVAARITRAGPRAGRPRDPKRRPSGWYVRQDG